MSVLFTSSQGLNINGIGATGPSGNTSYGLVYDPISKKVTYSNKTFVIDHPEDDNKFLVHACLEGPEAGVYYRGKASITNDEYVKVLLPSYVNKLASNFTIHITQIYVEGETNDDVHFKTTEVIDNSFKVYGKNGRFFWIVYGERNKIDAEVLKNTVDVKGDGPYKWI